MNTLERERAMRSIVATQCTGASAAVFFINGFLLAYLSALGMSSTSILQLLTLPHLSALFLILPAASLSDRFGKKRVGTIGLWAMAFGFLCLSGAAGFSENLRGHFVIAGFLIYGFGNAFFGSGWFALLSPIIPKEGRGRFFGRLRIAWQSTSILLTLGASTLLKHELSFAGFQVCLTVMTLLLMLRIRFYRRIPELEEVSTPNVRIWHTLKDLIRLPNYMPFCSYVFLLTLFIGACPWVFGLLEKDVLAFSQDLIVFMGTLLLIGSLAGFYAGGKMVDRLGTKYVFLACHFSFSAVLILFQFRQLIPLPEIVTIAGLTTGFGLIQAASGIAVTSELLGILPDRNKSLATSLVLSLQTGAIALSGLLTAKILDAGLLSERWIFFGSTMSRYDSILLGCAVMLLLLTVTLGLIPSIVKSAQWIPR